jgi:hypothetical protein
MRRLQEAMAELWKQLPVTSDPPGSGGVYGALSLKGWEQPAIAAESTSPDDPFWKSAR